MMLCCLVIKNKCLTYKNNNEPKLILYQAPTGTGKTMTPVGLVNSKTVIFNMLLSMLVFN